MPIDLTTDYDPGDIDVDYTHVKVTKIIMNVVDQFIQITTQHGTISEGNFVSGIILPGKTTNTFTISGTDYTTMIAELCASTSEKIYDEVARVLYEWLIDEGHFAGTVV